uniref:hypothetical protein n=1 Tax=Trichocoleus desertorum TaxID=1481672 RepID=UPI0025B32A67|nr:hypothetical protein [Trichocoleus desertorum]
MSTQNFLSIKKVVSLASVAGVSALLALPAMAQMQPSPANSNSPAQCLPSTSQVTPSDSPAGGATMEQMQASGTQSMDQSNINMNSPYSGSADGSSSQANAGYMGSQMGSQNVQADQSISAASPDYNRSFLSSGIVTPTRGPAGGYTMLRFQEMDGNQVASSNTGMNQASNSSYRSNYQANTVTPSAGPAGGYTANSIGNNNMGMNQSSAGMTNNNMGMNQSSVDNQYSASDTMRPLAGSMSSDRNRPAGEMTPEVSQSLDNQNNSIYRIGPSGSNSSSQYNSGSAMGGC